MRTHSLFISQKLWSTTSMESSRLPVSFLERVSALVPDADAKKMLLVIIADCCKFKRLCRLGQLSLDRLQQMVAEEEPAQRLLHAATPEMNRPHAANIFALLTFQ